MFLHKYKVHKVWRNLTHFFKSTTIHIFLFCDFQVIAIFYVNATDTLVRIFDAFVTYSACAQNQQNNIAFGSENIFLLIQHYAVILLECLSEFIFLFHCFAFYLFRCLPVSLLSLVHILLSWKRCSYAFLYFQAFFTKNFLKHFRYSGSLLLCHLRPPYPNPNFFLLKWAVQLPSLYTL